MELKKHYHLDMNYGLNDEQWDAIICKSPVVVTASAGSGKTRCLVAKIQYLLDNGTSPGSVCAITFTNKAANEMKERLKPHHSIKDMQISTIHSMCIRIMKEFPQFTPLKVPFSIYDDNDQLSIIKTIMKSRAMLEDPYEMLSAISKAKADQKEKELIDKEKIVYDKYQEILTKNNACDFDDILVYANQCLKQDVCRNHFINKWPHILTDEVQDTSRLQFEIIMAMFDPARTETLYLIGDISQSIYGWRGAYPDNIQDFIKKYNPSVKFLTYNYRSCSEVIAHANTYQQFGKPMVAKTATTGKVSVSVFGSQEDEANKIADALLKMGNYENTAVLYRMNTRSLLFERAFAMKRIPYKVVGDIPFYKRKISKDLMGFLKASANPRDIESLLRIVNVPKRGFGEAKQEKLLTDGWTYLHEMSNEMPSIKSFIELLNAIRNMSPVDAMNEVLFQTNYRNGLIKESDTNMVDALLNIASGFSSIDEMVLASTFLEEDTGNGVKLMTAHASKGLEFDRVFVVGVEDGVWPHARSENIEEEERLYYVAVTRAKKYLNISYSMSRLYRGVPMQMSPSYLFVRSSDRLKN
jgi:DNA helicase-2/ATP-dependent DNA helicase PcrA